MCRWHNSLSQVHKYSAYNIHYVYIVIHLCLKLNVEYAAHVATVPAHLYDHSLLIVCCHQ
jgi:hypothetical protein